MKLVEEILNAYKEMVNEGRGVLGKAEEKAPPERFQIRRILIDPPGYVLLLEKGKDGLWKGVALTEWVELARTDIPFPGYIVTKTETLVPLPSFLYLSEEFIKDHTRIIGSVEETVAEKILEYAKKANVPKEGLLREFFEEEIPRLEAISLEEIVSSVDREDLRSYVTVVTLTSRVIEILNRYAGIPSAEAPSEYLRGRNWIGVLKEGKLRLYLPREALGRSVRVKISGETVYEGPGRAVLLIENLPRVRDYTFLERDLEVEYV